MLDVNVASELSDLVFTVFTALLVYACYRNYYAPRYDKYSTFWPRFWAPTFDELVLWIPNVLVIRLLAMNMVSGPNGIGVLHLVTVIIFYTYSIYFHAKFGATLGKHCTRVRVVDAKTEGSITLKQAFLRDCIPMVLVLGLFPYVWLVEDGDLSESIGHLRLIPLVYGLWFLAEIITMLTNKKRRALHDFLAGTVVVRTNLKIPMFAEHEPLPNGTWAASQGDG